MLNVEIIPVAEEHIEGFWSAVDSVARECKYLVQPLPCMKNFDLKKEGIHKNAVCIDGNYENHVFMAL